MRSRSHILALVLVAVLALGAFAHAVSMTTMTVDMALTEGGAMSMDDCDDCGSDDAGAACDYVCGPNFVATAIVEQAQPSPIAGRDAAGHVGAIVGRTGPPEPYPPRTLIAT
jgi:hypothetical protein